MGHERDNRMANKPAPRIDGEGLRSAFAISAEHVLTAWHCVREAKSRGERLWFRLRDASAEAGRRYVYLPMRALEWDAEFDVAVLVLDGPRLGDAGLSAGMAAELLAGSVIPLGVDVSVFEQVRVMGFPANAPATDSATISAQVVDLTLPLGQVTCLSLFGPGFAAVDPLNPHGLSGGPVLKMGSGGGDVAVGVVRGVPVSKRGGNALGGGLFATRVEDVAGRLPQIAAALLANASVRLVTVGPVQRSDGSLAALLRADADLVRFLGRDRELQELHAWCAGPDQRAAWLVTGPGGQGKSRLAMQLCSELTSSEGWAAVILRGPSDATKVSDLLRRAAAACWSLLVVVDYAAEFGAAAFAGLITVLTDNAGKLPRWRLLLLARNTGDWWQPSASGVGPGTAVRLQLTAGGAEVPQKELALPPLIPDPGARRSAFGEIAAQLRPTVATFAATHGMLVADPPIIPDLSGVDLGSALMLHIAAIVSMQPSAGKPLSPAGPPSAIDLINRILDLECERHWLYSDATGARLYRPVEQAFGDLAWRTGTRVETAVAAATLVGAPHHYAATQLVIRALDVPQTRAEDIARWLHDLYPAAEVSSRPTWLPPLQPDRLGEELIARVIRREQEAGIPSDRLLPRRLLGRDSDPLNAGQVQRLLTVMIRAGARDRDIADLLADATGHGGLLSDIPDDIDLSEIADALPRMNMNLLGGAVAVLSHEVRRYEAAYAGWRETDLRVESARRGLFEVARVRFNLAVCLTEAGRAEDSLVVANQATELFRRLAEEDPAAYLPNLALSLTTLGVCQGSVGHGVEALAPAKEAVEIHQQLVEMDSGYLPDLVRSLTNLGNRLGELGLRAEALKVARMCISPSRALAEMDPAVYLPELARSLNNLSGRLANLSIPEEALAAIQEAVNIRRQLAESDAATHLPDLASSLTNLAARLLELGREAPVARAAYEAVEIRRLLAKANPAAYLPGLGFALDTLGNSLVVLGRPEEALAASKEAVEIRRQLAEANTAAYLDDLAASLNNLGIQFAVLRHEPEALLAAAESVKIRLQLAEANPVAYIPDLSLSLRNLENRLTEVGFGGAASQAWEDAAARLGPEAHVLRLLRAAWEWVSAPSYEAQRDHLATHPELLAPGTEDHLVHVLRYEPPEAAERYLVLLEAARANGVDAAYRDLDG